MTTGIKAIDALISRYGLRVREGKDAFQAVSQLHGGDGKAESLRLPWCMFDKVMHQPVSVTLRYHQFFLPHRQQRLASFLINEKGDIIEQVFYVRDARGVKACHKLQLMLQSVNKELVLAA